MTPTTLKVTDEDRAEVRATVDDVLAGGAGREDDRFRAVPAADDAGASFIRSMADEASRHLDGKPADRILAWAAAVVPRFCLTSSFGADAAVLLHLLSETASHVPVLFLDTGYHFPETIDYRRRLARDLGLSVVDVKPELSVRQQDERHGVDLFLTDPDACCGLRKTTPLRRMLGNYDGWATGVRRVQTPERAATPIVEGRPHAERWLVKVAPLATWSDDEVTQYVADHDLPAHPLVARNFLSIGCGPCTRPVRDGEDPRAGRWSSFEGKTECGIHLADDGDVVRSTTTPG